MTHPLLLSALAVLAAGPSQEPASPAADAVAAERGPFAVVLELEGTLDDPGAVEVAYRPEAYSGALEVAAVEQPGAVIEGQWLVKLETEEIDEQLARAQMDLEIARTRVARLGEEAAHQEEASAIELEKARMAHDQAEETLGTFKDVLMPMKLAEAELGIQSAKDRLQEEEEQFAQLQKMYGSDDLVEETEEIVLGRAQRNLVQGRKRLDFSLRRHELFKSVEVPRELQGYEFALRKATNDLELAKVTTRLAVERKQAELEKARWELELQERAFAQLQGDRAALVVKAPAAGIAVPGLLVRGKWTRLEETARSLRPGERIAADSVLFTIVQPGPKRVRTTVPEASVLDVQPGQEATIAPAASPGSTIHGTLVRVAPVSADGNFDAWLEVDDPDLRLIAGNSCSISLTTAELADAISVPSTALSKQDGRDVVHVLQEGQAEPREVRVGPRSQGRTVVLSGLEAGELVLRTSPQGRAR